MVLLKDGNYLENTETINAFRRLMNSFDIEDNLIEEIIDQSKTVESAANRTAQIDSD